MSVDPKDSTILVQLTRSQIEAAGRLHARLPDSLADDALAKLSRAVPDFDPVSTLLKVAALNQVSGGDVKAIAQMAAHASAILEGTADDRLVERIAALPGGRKTGHLVFASKFAHYFVNPDRFPVLDPFAVKALDGFGFKAARGMQPYQSFAGNVRNLKMLAGLTCSGRELDRFLRLTGLLRAWRKSKRAKIDAKAVALFRAAAHEPAIAEDLARMSPDR